MLRLLVSRMRDFARDTRGTMTVEAALMLPLLCFFYVASFVWFDAFRAQNTNLKAAYTIADMVSREQEVDSNYLNGLNIVFDYLTFSNHSTYVRVTSVVCRSNCDDDGGRDLDICWSWASAGRSKHDESSFSGFEASIPLMPVGDTVMFTETFMAYTPPFSVGIGTQRFENVVVTRPRFSPEVEFADGGTRENCY